MGLVYLFYEQKKYKHLTLDQRYIIESGLKKGLLKKEIAELVGVSPSTITREIKRNANKSGRYTQMHAQMLANEDKERVKRNKKIGKGVWKKVIEKLGVKVYFADPYSSWQKGTIEYSNKLLRQYLKKNEDFKDITNKQVLNYVQKINSRPRKKHQYRTPMAVWLENYK